MHSVVLPELKKKELSFSKIFLSVSLLQAYALVLSLVPTAAWVRIGYGLAMISWLKSLSTDQVVAIFIATPRNLFRVRRSLYVNSFLMMLLVASKPLLVLHPLW